MVARDIAFASNIPSRAVMGLVRLSRVTSCSLASTRFAFQALPDYGSLVNAG